MLCETQGKTSFSFQNNIEQCSQAGGAVKNEDLVHRKGIITLSSSPFGLCQKPFLLIYSMTIVFQQYIHRKHKKQPLFKCGGGGGANIILWNVKN